MIRGKVRILDGGVLAIFCPACKSYHMINVFNNETPHWDFNNDYDKPTFNPSLLLKVEKRTKPAYVCHCFIRDGKIEFLSDCTHKLAGMTVGMLDEEAIKTEIEKL